MTNPQPTEAFSAAVVIPARNEETRLPDCLSALAAAISRLGRPVLTVVAVNDSTDRTIAVARAALSRFPYRGDVLELHEAPGVGAARAAGFAHALQICGDDVVLLGTDADSRVDIDWLVQMMTELQHADVIFGAVSPDPGELAAIGAMKARFNSAEGQYMQAAVTLAARLDPLPHDPDPSHRNPSGANFGLHGANYCRIGGIPPLRLAEDRELARRAELFDLRLRFASSPRVVTSCRLEGRTAGGMAAALRARRQEHDPLCDEWLEPAQSFIDRHRLRAALRAVWPDQTALRRILAMAGFHEVPAVLHTTFGAFWHALETTQPRLVRRRMRQSAAARELPMLLRHLETAIDPMPQRTRSS